MPDAQPERTPTRFRDLVNKLAGGEEQARDALESLVAEAVTASRGQVPQARRIGALCYARRALAPSDAPQMERAFRAVFEEPVEGSGEPA